MKPIPNIILAPLIAHPLWAVFMLTAPMPIHTIGIDAIYTAIPSQLPAAIAMVLASALAWLSHCDRWHAGPVGLSLIMPQQFIMLLSMWTVILSVITATYANRYAPPEGWRFIAADQILFFVCSILHTKVIFQTYVHRPLL